MKMPIRTLKCPLNDNYKKIGPITNTFYSQYELTEEEIRLFEKLSYLPKPKIKKNKKKDDSE